jgi:uroporphyrinogen decarboxylase
MRQAGRYLPEYRRLRERHTILELCERPDLAAEITLQPVRRLGVDAAILFADILLPARPLGLKLEFRRGEGPCLTPRVRSKRDVARLREFDPKTELGFVLEAIRLIRRELAILAKPGERPTPLIGFAGAPFTLASYIIEGGPSDHYLHTKALMHSDPKAWHSLMGKLSRITSAYLRAQVEAGAQAVQLFDSWVGCLSREDYVEFVLPHSRAVLQALRGLAAPVIHFGTGTSGFLRDFSAAGGDVIGVDWRMPLNIAWKMIGYNRAIQGNLDPAILAASPLRSIKKQVQEILFRTRGRRGHIFNLGHGILPSTPVAHVKAAVEWVHEMSLR